MQQQVTMQVLCALAHRCLQARVLCMLPRAA
jgi:hypothetical protein